MKRIIYIILFFISPMLIAQETDLDEKKKKTTIADFQLSNVTSPAFLLIDETPTSIYTTENLRALMIHSLQNLGENLSIEVTPYFFIKDEKRTYYKYMGIEHISGKNDTKSISNDDLKQNPFSRIGRDLTVSFAYIEKEFNDLGEKNKTFSLGARTTLFRVYNEKRKRETYNNAIARATLLSNLRPPDRITQKGGDAIKKYYKEFKEEKKDSLNKEFEKLDQEFTKTIKPTFQVDGALGYGLLFKDNNIKSATLKRFGTWLTASGSFRILNNGEKTKKNNYINIFAIGRYVEDGFSLNTNGTDNTLYYRDFGGKIELEVGDFAFGYEYIRRNGSVDNYKSLGNIKYVINKEVSLTGGFGKDFTDTNNLITLFGINWGLNLGSNKLKL